MATRQVAAAVSFILGADHSSGVWVAFEATGQLGVALLTLVVEVASLVVALARTDS